MYHCRLKSESQKLNSLANYLIYLQIPVSATGLAEDIKRGADAVVHEGKDKLDFILELDKLWNVSEYFNRLFSSPAVCAGQPPSGGWVRALHGGSAAHPGAFAPGNHL